MPTAQSVLHSVLDDLKSLGTEQYRKTFARHGIPLERTYGVSNAHLKTLAKSLTKSLKSSPDELQALALELYDTGIVDAMYLAGMLADGAKMSRKQLQHWAEESHAMSMIAEHTVPWVTVESPDARHLAIQWIASKRPHVASSGWCTYSGIVATTPDEKLDLPEIDRLLTTIEAKIGSARDREKYTMNSFVIAVGTYMKPLRDRALATAAKIGTVIVDMGDTDCKVPDAAAYIAKTEAAGKLGPKRKTIRC
jgi:3-methyladenine DNA glycosylase AlkD